MLATKDSTATYRTLLAEFFAMRRGKQVAIVEIGCGVNPKHKVLIEIANQYNVALDYIGVDIGKEQIEYCRRNQLITSTQHSVRFYIRDASSISMLDPNNALAPKSIDLVLACHPVMDGSWVYNNMFKRIFRNIVPKLLKNDGLLLSDFCYEKERKIFDNLALINNKAAKNQKISVDGLTTVTKYSPNCENVYFRETKKQCCRGCGFFVAAVLTWRYAGSAVTAISNIMRGP